jgi:hypothetical protein
MLCYASHQSNQPHVWDDIEWYCCGCALQASQARLHPRKASRAARKQRRKSVCLALAPATAPDTPTSSATSCPTTPSCPSTPTATRTGSVSRSASSHSTSLQSPSIASISLKTKKPTKQFRPIMSQMVCHHHKVGILLLLLLLLLLTYLCTQTIKCLTCMRVTRKPVLSDFDLYAHQYKGRY